MSMISPPLSHRTTLGSLDGWNLVMKCPNCGDRNKPVRSLCEVVKPSREVGEIFPRLSCDGCRSKPAALIGVCTWIVAHGRDAVSEDWTFLLKPKEEQVAA